MAKRKLAASDSGPIEVDDRSRKRRNNKQRISGQVPSSFQDYYPTTYNVHCRFRQYYGLRLNVQYFVGLCAYLYAILTHGFAYQAPGLSLDAFIISYVSYHRTLPALKESQLKSDQPRIPSYHIWLQSYSTEEGCDNKGQTKATSPGGTTSIPSTILTPELLKQVGRENRYKFSWTYWTLRVLTVRARQRRELREIYEEVVDP